MLSEAELVSGMRWASQHSEYERTFFADLVGANVYVVPDGPGLAHVRHPDGFAAIAMFTQAARAERAFGKAPCLVASVRALFWTHPDVIFILDPDDGGCLLLPEERRVLLRGGALPMLQRAPLHLAPSRWCTADVAPRYMARLQAVMRRQPAILAAYCLVPKAWAASADPRSWLLVLIVEPAVATRTVHATVLGLARGQPAWPGTNIVTIDPIAARPAWCRGDVSPVYQAMPRARLTTQAAVG